MPDRQSGGTVLVGDQEALSLLAGQGDSLALAGALLMDILGPVVSPRGSVRRWRPVVEEAQAAGKRTASSFLPVNRTQRLVSPCWRCRCVRASK